MIAEPVKLDTSEALAFALDHPERLVRHLPLGRLLIQSQLISPDQCANALRIQTHTHEKLGTILIREGIIKEADLLQLVSQNLNIPFINAAKFKPPVEIVDLVPAEFSRTHNVIPIMLHHERLVVAMNDPMDNEVLNLLHFLSGRVIEPVLASSDAIEFAISQSYGFIDDEEALRTLPVAPHEPQLKEYQAKKLAEDKPTVRLVNHIILDAISRRASDIHIRPNELDVDLIFRIDGALVKIRSFNKSLLPSAVSRIKIISGMNIAERRVPQDGRTKIHVQGKIIDLRVSVMPALHGESVVIRILDTSAGMKDISEIGFSKADEDKFRRLIQRSSGLILVTGPTGSGKSTTLYSALKEVRQRNINIITVEDPVEYQIQGITQLQINPQIGYTFARALRHILRHDPDTIMLGEIRDEETAKMAIESALTGHLVLSTLHTNSAASTITRLLEIGIPPYLVKSTVLAVLAQRLVRKNCPHCLQPVTLTASERKIFNLPEDTRFYQGSGCDHCHQTGYAGRLAVYELLEVDSHIRQLITPSCNELQLEKVAHEHGMRGLTRHALSLAEKQLTSMEEVFRIRTS